MQEQTSLRIRSSPSHPRIGVDRHPGGDAVTSLRLEDFVNPTGRAVRPAERNERPDLGRPQDRDLHDASLKAAFIDWQNPSSTRFSDARAGRQRLQLELSESRPVRGSLASTRRRRPCSSSSSERERHAEPQQVAASGRHRAGPRPQTLPTARIPPATGANLARSAPVLSFSTSSLAILIANA
jgi:hypothetical protein